MNKCKKCKSKNVMGIEYGYPDPYRYDGISEWQCKDCGYREGKWTKKELKADEKEPPYGNPKYVTKESRPYNW